MNSSGTLILEAHGIHKSFPGVHALANVALSLGHGEVLAVIGENGAGKSTLMKILAGIQKADSGSLLVDGVEQKFTGVLQAQDAGIALIHQELLLAGNLDIASNICLGREPRRPGWLGRLGFMNQAKAVALAQKGLAQVGLDLAPTTPVDGLSIGQRQLVEIAKALAVDTRILIMDEPTSSLSAGETERLFEVIASLKQRGVSVVYISHRLAEVEAIADRVVVLRDGENAGELEGDEIKHEAMVRLMIGRDVSRLHERQSPDSSSPSAASQPLLEIQALSTQEFPKHQVDLKIHPGEIVALAGLVGAGRTELLECLFGIRKPLKGTVRVAGNLLETGNTVRAVNSGLALVPEDRQGHGLFMEQSVGDNLSITSLPRQQRAGFRSVTKERQVIKTMIARLGIKVSTSQQVAGTLSGGNQQKIVLGKWLATDPSVLLLDEPTRGVDIGAKSEIYGLMEELAAQGLCILFASSELEEILGIAHKVVVMREGQITGVLDHKEMSEQSIMMLATRTESGA